MAARDIEDQRLNWGEEKHPDRVWVRVGGGTSEPNRVFRDQWDQLFEQKIPRGAYWVAIPALHTEPAAEARRLYRIVGQLRTDDLVAAKVTETRLPAIETTRWLIRFFQVLTDLYGPRVHMGSTKDFIGELSQLRTLTDLGAWFVKADKWVEKDTVGAHAA